MAKRTARTGMGAGRPTKLEQAESKYDDWVALSADASTDAANVDHEAFAREDFSAGLAALRPPARMTPSAGAAKVLRIGGGGNSPIPWSADETPYMVEPMDMTASRAKQAVVFVGGARTGKSMGLILGTLAHRIAHDPGDALIIHLGIVKAREFSKMEFGRMLENSPALVDLKSPRFQDSATFDVKFRHGMFARIAWPTIEHVSSSTYRYTYVTDYDRIDNADNVDGEGDLFTLLRKRTTTFMSRGSTVAESSPGREITDPHWRPRSPHEAPPVGGILGLYNMGDRRRYYWKCPHCNDRFEAEPGFGLFKLPPIEQLIEDARILDEKFVEQHSSVWCPNCGSQIGPEHKAAMNRTGLWLPEGCHFDHNDRIDGSPRASEIASYWQGGVTAAFQPWKSLVSRYITAVQHYADTAEEDKIKVVTNVDAGAPYLPRHLAEIADKTGEVDKYDDSLERYVVPAWARFVTAHVDVQGGANARFVVQIHAWGEHHEMALINRFAIRESRRPGADGGFAPIDPATYAEDWERITDEVVKSTYRTTVNDIEIRPVMTSVDGYGEAGVTTQAYAWFRRMAAAGFGSRVKLTKGASDKTAPLIRMTMVGGLEGKQNDIPLALFNPNLVKDAVAASYRRERPGPGFIHIPRPKDPVKNPGGWMAQAVVDEISAEVRLANGTWKRLKGSNETLDLLVAGRVTLMALNYDRIKDWADPPRWARKIGDGNSNEISAEERRAMKAAQEADAGPSPPLTRAAQKALPRRRSAGSGYLR